ncbi:MAG TPA: hypothetical protein PLD25_19540 [Chloroflexota bacterium]|nr:hypothetical protein [Chloroflexota bacterium]
MSGLPPELLNPLRALLEQLDQFKDASEIPALFGMDARLALWRRRLPDMNGLALVGRVNRLIAYLLPLRDQDGRSALVLFLQVLSEELDPQDAHRRQLDHLIQQLDAWLKQTTDNLDKVLVLDDSGEKEEVLKPLKPPVQIPKSTILIVLQRRFALEELKTLCFHLSADFDDLPGEGKVGKARELIKYLERRDRLPELINEMNRQRPNIEWRLIEQVVEFDHFQVILLMEPTTWGAQVQNTSQQKLKRIRLSLLPPATLWLNPQQINIGDLTELAASSEVSLSVSSRQSEKAHELVIEAVYLVSGLSTPVRSRRSCQVSI